MDEPVLKLSTVTKRTVIEIDCRDYRLRRRGDFSILGGQEMAEISNRIAIIEAKPKPSKKDDQAYKALLRSMVSKLVIDLPLAKVKALDKDQLKQIILAFSGRLPTQQVVAPVPGATARTPKRTLARSSQS